jgi:hypothetical protein
MKNIVKKIMGAVLVAGLLLGGSVGPSFAVLPPDGDPVQKIYVDNVKGNDKNDGSSKYPLKTVDWAFRVMNSSYASSIEMYIRGNYIPYQTDGSINFKRSNVLVSNWGSRPLIEGVVPEGAWHLADMALDSQSGITVQNIDFLNVIFDGYTTPSISGASYDVTLRNLVFKIYRTDLLGEDPVIWFHQQGPTDYGNRSIFNLMIDRIRIGVGSSKDTFEAIKIQNVDGASVYRNTFYGTNWDAGVNVENSANVALAQNSFLEDGKLKMSLYKFHETDNSMVYNRMQ